MKEDSDCGTSTTENGEGYMPDETEEYPELSTEMSHVCQASQMANDNDTRKDEEMRL